MDYTIKKLAKDDGGKVIDIFNYYIKNSYSAYFTSSLPDVFADKLFEIIGENPAFSAHKADDELVGFAFAHDYHIAPAFNKTKELTYFIHPDYTSKGIGKTLLNTIVEESKKNGTKNLLANISSKNKESLFFHEVNGFKYCGKLDAVGSKFNEDFDIVYMQLKI